MFMVTVPSFWTGLTCVFTIVFWGGSQEEKVSRTQKDELEGEENFVEIWEPHQAEALFKDIYFKHDSTVIKTPQMQLYLAHSNLSFYITLSKTSSFAYTVQKPLLAFTAPC